MFCIIIRFGIFKALFTFLLVVIFTAHSTFADRDITGRQLPRFEAGFALLNFYLPDYPGADESSYRVLPVPYLIYRGEVFRSDREGGLRGRFLNSEKIEFDLSFSAAFPTDADDNSARPGMPDLDWLGEFGPRLKYRLYNTHMVKFDFELPVRYVFSTDMHYTKARGYTTSPELSFQHRALFDVKGFFSASLTGVWATEPLMDYFYEVQTREQTSSRPPYQARGGHMYTNTRISFVHLISQKFIMFMGVSRNWFAHAENRASPLLRDIETESYFLGLAWGLYQSQSRGPAE